MLIKRPGSSSTTSDKSGLHMRAKSRMFSISSRADSGDGGMGVKSGRQSVSFDQHNIEQHPLVGSRTPLITPSVYFFLSNSGPT